MLKRFTKAIVVLSLGCLALLNVLDASAECGPARLAVSITSGPTALVDSKAPGVKGPSVVTLSAVVTNTGTGPASNLVVYIGDGKTPGSFLEVNGKKLSLLGGVTDASRSLGSLDPQKSRTVFWQVFYPATMGIEYPYKIWATADGDCSESANALLRTHGSSSAGTNKIKKGTIGLSPEDGRVGPGQTLTLTVKGFDLGIIGPGLKGEAAAWLQPVGNTEFDPTCFRLLQTEILLKSISSTPYVNQLYIRNIGSANPAPNYDNKPEDYAKYTFIALKDCTTAILPYQQASTSNDQRYNADYGMGKQKLIGDKKQGSLILNKIVNPMTAEAGTTVSQTIFFGNLSNSPLGDPSNGNPVALLEVFPAGVSYVANSMYCGVECFKYWSTDGGKTFTGTEPAGSVNALKWVLVAPIPAKKETAGTVGFQAKLDRDTEVCTKITGRIGDGPAVAEETTCINSQADLILEQTGPTNILPGDSVEYLITYGNSGPSAAEDVVITDTLPPGAIFLNSVPSPDKISSDGKTLTYNVGSVLAKQSKTITIRLTAEPELTAGTALTNTAQGLMSTPEKNTQNNVSVFAPLILASTAPSLYATETVRLVDDTIPTGPSAGDTLEYTVVIANKGSASATSVLFQQPFSPEIRFLSNSVTTSRGKILENALGKGLTIDVGLVGPSEPVTIKFGAQIARPLSSEIDHIATQGFISSNELATVLTDDPHTPVPHDRTTVLLNAGLRINAYKSFSLVNASGPTDLPSKGDTLEFKIFLINQGHTVAESVILTDFVSPYMKLVPDSFKTSQGTLVSDTVNKSIVQFNLGNLSGNGGSATVTYRATVSSLPAGLTQLVTHAIVSGRNFPVQTTDNPFTLGLADLTTIPITEAPGVIAFLRANLLGDEDGNGRLSVGDTLIYSLNLVNQGGEKAEGVLFAITPDSHTELIAGSVGATQGTIVTGNAPGAKSVQIKLGAVAAGGEASASFVVRVSSAGATELAAQGLITGANFKNALTDDPTTLALGDPTLATLTQQPRVRAYQRATLLEDSDGDQSPSPGDTILYTVTVLNLGTATAENVTYAMSVDPNSSVLFDSVNLSQGSVRSDPVEEATEIILDLDDLHPGSLAQVSFLAKVNDPLASGVTQIAAQAKLKGDNFSVLESDDPDTPEYNDATVTVIGVTQSAIGQAVLRATMSDSLVNDVDGNGFPSAGDIIEYQMMVKNHGKGTAAGVVFTDIPDLNTTLIASSVSTNKGTVTLGNAPNDRSVRVDLGRMGPDSSATVSFRVSVSNGLPAGVTHLSNQGIVSDLRAPAVVTDDPATEEINDKTLTPLERAPLIRAFQTATLITDKDANQLLNAGDEVQYTVTILNLGNASAQSVTYTGTPDRHTALVPGSVSTSQGRVRVGQGANDRIVIVDLDKIEAGSRATLKFTLRLDSPLAPTVKEISMQGRVSGDNFPSEPTDDPSNPACDAPTVLRVGTAPKIDAFQRVRLFLDPDGNGMPSPGDTLLYTVQILNTGDQKADEIIYETTTDTSNRVIVGSVATDSGVVLQGNNSGDQQIQVQIGTILAKSAAHLSFRVMIDPSSAKLGELVVQGKVSGLGLADVLTDDPDSAAEADSTKISLDEAPSVEAFKTDLLVEDLDANGGPSPGDPLEYLVTIVNHGRKPAENVVYRDLPASHTRLLAGSVKTTEGQIVKGNQASDTEIQVDLGQIPPGGSVRVSFRVGIGASLPIGIDRVVRQGEVFGGNFPRTPTDDPATPTPADPTETPLIAFYVTCGDVDNDSKVELSDAMKAAQFALGTALPSPAEEAASDVVAPFGIIDVRDATFIAEVAIGIRPGCPANNANAARKRSSENAATMLLTENESAIRLSIEHQQLMAGHSSTLRIFGRSVLGGLQAGPQGGLRFDPRVIQIRDIRSSSGYTLLAQQIDNSRGSVRFLLVALNRLPQEAGPVLELDLEAIGSPGARTAVTLELDKAFDLEMRESKAIIEHGSIVLGDVESLSVARTFVTSQPVRRSPSVQFVVEGKGVKEMSLIVFDTNGSLVMQAHTQATSLEWKLTDRGGRLVANGVYFYVLRVRGYDGKIFQNKLGKLVISQ
jgi:uncharacterized repeat protein (TIGR01451 family)